MTGSLVIGIDPGVKSAVSLFHNGTFLAVEYVEPRNLQLWLLDILTTHHLEQDYWIGKLKVSAFIERPYLASYKGKYGETQHNPRNLINQSEVIGRWKERLEDIAAGVQEVFTDQWYCAVCRGIRADKRVKRKIQSLFYAGAVLGQKIIDHNLADALNIGQYGVGQVHIIKIKESANGM